jgi:hypothetical protein
MLMPILRPDCTLARLFAKFEDPLSDEDLRMSLPSPRCDGQR